jgi:GH15 family glucan-1,4-alpha-glucosidase
VGRSVGVRTDGYAAIRDYAAIGDGRTVALVARDGAIDWLCLPDSDSPPVFGRLVDAERGGSFRLEPVEPYEVERAYRDGSNVLETTFRTASGVVRVTDALTLADRTIGSPMRELVRRVDSLAGTVRMRWSVEPRFDFGRRAFRIDHRGRHIVVVARGTALALGAWGAGEPEIREESIEGELVASAGAPAFLSLASAHGEPLVFVGRGQLEDSLERTDRFWRDWSARAEYDGPWVPQVRRSALALKLLVYSPSGAIVAAPTTSLPERIGGSRNWDYRFAWLRDSTWSLDALLQLGYRDEADAFFWWFMHASRRTQPRLGVLYRIDGGMHSGEDELDLSGYRDSRPVRVGNGASGQLQLDIYGAVLDAVWRYAGDGGRIDKDTGKDVAKIADYVASIWEEPDCGLWEVRDEPRHWTQSKAMCWLALHRAGQLAEQGAIPDRRERWEPAAAQVREFFETHGWDDERRSFVRAPDVRELDASLLTLSLLDCEEAGSERMLGTIDAVTRELADGPFVYRYRGEDGLVPGEGAFLACSFWLAACLARAGRLDEAVERMERLLAAANDVGLYAEEIDPGSGEFLGNFPQGLTHLALINAASAIEEARQ